MVVAVTVLDTGSHVAGTRSVRFGSPLSGRDLITGLTSSLKLPGQFGIVRQIEAQRDRRRGLAPLGEGYLDGLAGRFLGFECLARRHGCGFKRIYHIIGFAGGGGHSYSAYGLADGAVDRGGLRATTCVLCPHTDG